MAARTKLSDVATELQPHQKRVVERIKSQPGLVVAHGMGSGKTLSSLAAAEELGMPTSVVVPAALQANYRKEMSKHLTGKKTKYTISSMQRAARAGAVPEGQLLVVDEAHRLRDPGTKAQKAVRESEAEKRLLLTGTPLYNRPHDLASLVNVAAGSSVLPSDRRSFDDRFIGAKTVNPGFVARVFRGVKPGSVPELKNRKELGDVLQKWVDYHDSSGSADFPTRRDVTVETPMGEKQRELYDAIMGEAPSWARYKVKAGLPPSKAEAKQLNAFLNAARQVAVSPGGFVEGMDPGQSAELSPKMQEAFTRLSQSIAKNPEHRALVYSNFLESGISPYEAMLKSKNVAYGKFTGQQSKSERQGVVDAYNSGKLRALLLSSAGGEGLDLKGTRQIQVLDPHWNKEKLEQVIARGIRYKSHADLPEDQRNVDVERYLSVMPEPSRVRRLFGSKRPGAVDEYLSRMSEDKDLLNQQVRDLMKQPGAKTAGKARTKTTTHTKTLPDGRLVDVVKLWELTEGLPTHEVDIASTKATTGISRSSNTGFGRKRLREADHTYPILIHGSLLLDGRHRTAKAADSGMTTLRAKEVPAHLIEQSIIKTKRAGLVHAQGIK